MSTILDAVLCPICHCHYHRTRHDSVCPHESVYLERLAAEMRAAIGSITSRKRYCPLCYETASPDCPECGMKTETK